MNIINYYLKLDNKNGYKYLINVNIILILINKDLLFDILIKIYNFQVYGYLLNSVIMIKNIRNVKDN